MKNIKNKKYENRENNKNIKKKKVEMWKDIIYFNFSKYEK